MERRSWALYKTRVTTDYGRLIVRWLRTFFCLSAVMMVSSAQAGLIYDLQSFAGAAPQTLFTQGDTVTMRLVAIDTPGTPVLGTDGWLGFTARITASTTDPNDAGGATNPFGFTSDDGAPFNTTGRTYGGGGSLPSTNPQTILTFSYVADVLGSTVFDFNNTIPAFNVANFTTGNFTTANGLQLQGQTVDVVAIPEPSSLGLLSIVGVAAGSFRRFRRKATSQPC